MGVKIDTIYNELVSREVVKVDLSDNNTILEHFQKFCSDRDIPYKEGEKYLKQAING